MYVCHVTISSSCNFQCGNDHSEVKQLEQLYASEYDLFKAGYLDLTTKRNQLIDEYKKIYQIYEKTQEEFLNQVVQWKREQQLVGNGLDLNKDQLPILQVKYFG